MVCFVSSNTPSSSLLKLSLCLTHRRFAEIPRKCKVPFSKNAQEINMESKLFGGETITLNHLVPQ